MKLSTIFIIIVLCVVVVSSGTYLEHYYGKRQQSTIQAIQERSDHLPTGVDPAEKVIIENQKDLAQIVYSANYS